MVSTNFKYFIIWILGVIIILGGIYGLKNLTQLPPVGRYVLTDDFMSCLNIRGQFPGQIWFENSAPTGGTSYVEGDSVRAKLQVEWGTSPNSRSLYFMDGMLFNTGFNDDTSTTRITLCHWACIGGAGNCYGDCMTNPTPEQTCFINYNIPRYSDYNKLPAGRHYIEFVQIGETSGVVSFGDYIDVASRPCSYSAGQMLVMDRFTAGDTISSSTTTYLPVGYCSDHAPLVLDDNTMRSWRDCQSSDPNLCDNILTKLRNNQPYVVPAGKQVGLFYISDKPYDMVVVCPLG